MTDSPSTPTGRAGDPPRPSQPRLCLALHLLACWCAVCLPFSSLAGGYVPGCTEPELLYALTGGGQVDFAENCSITLTSPIQITEDTTIDAGDFTVTLTGGGKVRLFEVLPGKTLALTGLRLTGGLSTNGGAIYVGANANLVLERCTFSGNSAKGAAGASGGDGADNDSGNGGNGHDGKPGQEGLGGAIFSLGSLVIRQSSFITNSAVGGNGGAGGNGGDAGSADGETGEGWYIAGSGGSGAAGAPAAGGAIYSAGSISLEDSTFSQNSAIGGNGGVGGAAGEARYAGLNGNGGSGAAADGGAVFTTASFEAVRCTLSDNSARGGNGTAGGNLENGNGRSGRDGGNASGGALRSSSDLSLLNCTLYNNRALGGGGGTGGDADLVAGNGGDGGNGYGGGVYNLGASSLTHCTVAEGGAYGGTNGVAGTGRFDGEPGSKGRSRGGNLMNAGPSFFALQNTIIGPSRSGTTGYGTFEDLGGNLSSDKSLSLTAASISGTDPRLGSLGNYGGPEGSTNSFNTFTVNLLPGSPAVNAAQILDDVSEDQRGEPRPDPVSKKPDIGAFEGQGPKITANPTNQTKSVFGSASFSVVAQGDPPLRYNWLFNGELASGGTNSTFTLSTLTTNSAGLYSVIVSNAFGAVTSAPAMLTVVYPPLIRQQPTNQSVVVGSTVQFRVVATGADPLAYQWFFNTTNRLALQTNSVLTLTNVQPAQAGRYSVTVTNLGGSETSLPATLTLVNVPTISSVQTVSNQFVIRLATSGSNYVYVLEATPGLAEPDWTPLATNIGSGGLLIFQDPVSLTNSSRYYRLLQR